LAVFPPDERQEAGLLCRSLETMRLYWLSASRVAWMPLTVEQLTLIFLKDKRPFKVILKKRYPSRPFISLIDIEEIRREWDNLEIGQRLHVDILMEMKERASDGKRFYLAQHMSNRMAMCCVLYSENSSSNELPQETMSKKALAVELAERSYDPEKKLRLVVVTPLGKRPLYLDLPEGLAQFATQSAPNQIERSGEQGDGDPTAELSRYRDEDIGKLSNTDLDRLLIDAYTDRHLSHPLAVRIAYEWKRRHENDEEMHVLPALMAILLLHKTGSRNRSQKHPGDTARNNTLDTIGRDQQKEAVQLACNLGRRALRSGHVEALILNWLSNKNATTFIPSSRWKRLHELLQFIPGNLEGKNFLKREELDAINNFCRAVRFSGVADSLVPIAESLTAAIGQPTDLSQIMKKAMTVQELINMYRSLSGRRVEYLHECHVQLLQRNLEMIQQRRIDIILLDPLPELVYGDDKLK
jgi:hypothetical protein